jgi:hypothetical protein
VRSTHNIHNDGTRIAIWFDDATTKIGLFVPRSPSWRSSTKVELLQQTIRISSAWGSHDKDFVNLNFTCAGFLRRVLRAADDKDFVNPEALAIYRFANLNICDVALITPSSTCIDLGHVDCLQRCVYVLH